MPSNTASHVISSAELERFARALFAAAGVAPAMLFASADVVYVWVRGTIQRSDDNGVHWTQVLTPGT